MRLTGEPRILSYSMTLRVPAWASLPTAQAYNAMYQALQPQLDLDHLQTPGVPPSCVMGKGAALQIQIVPAQGLFQYVRNLEAAETSETPQDVDRMTQEFLAALEEARKALSPVLLVSPAAQLRAAWPLNRTNSIDFLRDLAGTRLNPDRLRTGLVLGYHLMQLPPQAAAPEDLGLADVRVEPFLRELNSIWIETTFSYPIVAIAGAVGVVIAQGVTPPGTDVKMVWDCGAKVRDLLYRVPAFLGLEADES